MTPREVIHACSSKNGAYLDYPFGPECTVVKVGKTDTRPGRIFAQVFKLSGRDMLTLNCDLMTGQFYRKLFPGIVVRGYHCPKVQQPYFNTLPLDGSVPDGTVYEMIRHSYETVVAKLPKYIQRELEREKA